MKIKTGDKVLVTHGKDRGKTGKVTDAFPEEHQVIVEGVNKLKKHVKPQKEGEKGQIVEINAPIDVSNVKLLCPSCNNKPSRVGYKVQGDEKYRVCKKCQKPVQ